MDTFPKHQPLFKFAIGRLSDCFDKYLKVAIWRNDRARLASLAFGARDAPAPIPPDDNQYWMTNRDWLSSAKYPYRCGWPEANLADVLINFHQLPGSAVKFLNSIGIDIKVKEYPHLNERTY